MALNSTELMHLFAHLVRSEKVTQQAIHVLLPTDFKDELEQPYAIIWAIASDWFKSTGKSKPKDLFLADLETRLSEAGPGWMDEGMVEYTKSILDFIYEYDSKKFVPDYAITNWLQALLNDKKVLPKLGNTVDQDELPSLIKSIADTYAATRVTAAAMCNPFDTNSVEADTISGTRIATGCTVYDDITCGGIRPRELVGILAGTGSGKTLISLHISIAMAKQGHNVLYLTYEQPVIPEIRDRMWSCATGISRGQIEGIKLSEMKPHVREAIQKAGQEIKTLMAADMTAKGVGVGGMDEVEALIQQRMACGFPPKLVVVDWVSTMARRYMAAHSVKEDGIRGVIMNMCSHAKNLCVKYETTIILCQQLSGEAGSKTSVTAKSSHYDALDCKSFALEMDTCIVIGPKDPKSSICILRSTKSRNVVSKEVRAKLDGEFNRFVPSDAEITGDRYGNTHLEEADESNAVDKDY